jgi:uncharacterized coiled-coil protein SlyX
MIARPWETEIEVQEDGEDSLPAPRQRSQPSPIGHLLSQNLLDEAVRALQEDLAMLQAEQERGLGSLGGALEQIGQEIGAVRAQLSALAEPLLNAQPTLPAEVEAERAEIEQRFERLEKQVGLLMRGMDSVDALRYQSDVHTRALARLTDLLGEVVRPRPVEGLEPLQHAVAALERSQRRDARFQLIALSLLGVGVAPGIGALVWLLLRSGLGL